MENEFRKTRVMKALEIGVEWEDSVATPEGRRILKAEGTVDMFLSNRATREQVEEHCTRVWATTSHGANTSLYHKRFSTILTDTTELETERNRNRLKHCIMGVNFWNSFTPTFQIDIMGSQMKCEWNDETDGVLLWDFLRRKVSPTTTIGASKLKKQIESRTLVDFDNGVDNFNTWFSDTRYQII